MAMASAKGTNNMVAKAMIPHVNLGFCSNESDFSSTKRSDWYFQ